MSKRANRSAQMRYCAFCKSERLVYLKRRLSWLDVCLAMASSLALSFVFWQDIDPRAIGIFAVTLAVAEIFVVLRRRLSMPCPRCGFDASLYKKDQAAASVRVRARLDQRRDDPVAWLAPMPKLPYLKVKKPVPPRTTAPAKTAVRLPPSAERETSLSS